MVSNPKIYTGLAENQIGIKKKNYQVSSKIISEQWTPQITKFHSMELKCIMIEILEQKQQRQGDWFE